MSLVLRFSIMPALTLKSVKIKGSFHIEQLKPELNKQVERVSLSLHFQIDLLVVYREF